MWAAIAIFANLARMIEAGQVLAWDIEMNYNNSGFASIFTIPFALESGMSSTDYVKVVFPFALHTTISNSLPVGLEARYSAASGDYKCGTGDYLTAAISLNLVSGVNQESTAYYISFFDLNEDRVALTAGQYYYLQIEITGTSVNIQSPGIKSPLQVYSVSSVSSVAIVYDRNPAFGTIALADYPLTEMTLSITFESSTTAAQLDSEYYIYVDTTMKQTIADSARVEIRFLDNAFTFTSECSTGSHSTNPYIPSLSTSLYSCAYDSDNNIVVFTILRAIAVNDVFRFIVNVKNPTYVKTLGQLQVRTMYSNANTIVEMQESDAIFSVSEITFASQNMQLGWGMEYSASSASFYPFNLQVLRQSATTSYIPYNAFRWLWKISDDLPDTSQIQIEIAVPNKLKTFILPGSISHTLPNYTGLTVTCYLNTQTDPTEAKIVCINIGKMYSSVEYSVGCRITFPYDLFTSPLEPNFGTITLYSVDPDTGDVIGDALSESKNPLSVVSTDNNPTWALSTNNLDYTVFSTATLTESINSASLSTLGAIPSSTSGSLQQFVFTMSIPLASITSTSGAISTGAGIIILANPNVVSLSMDDSPTVVTYNDALLTDSIGLYASIQSSDRASYRKIKVYATQSTDLSILLNGSGTNTYFRIKRGKVLRHTSYYADQYLMDFYIATFDQINSDSPIFKQIFLYNGYTINVGSLLKLRYGVSNYWSNSATSMDGSTVPVLLRIAGYFQSTDLGAARTKVVLFFKNMEPFYTSSDYTTTNTVSCYSSLSYSYTCSYFSSGQQVNGQSYTNYNRIEVVLNKIPIGSSEKFQLIIPMKSYVGMQNQLVSIYLGGLKTSSLYSSGSNLNSITQVYRLTGKSNIASLQLFTQLPSTVSKDYTTLTSSYQWSLPTSVKVGSTSVYLGFLPGNAATATATTKNNVNIANLNGASFTVCSEWNFVTSSSSFEFPLASSDNTGSCLSFQYAASFSGTTPSYRYGVYCPFESSAVSSSTAMHITNSFLPYINGNLPPAKMAVAWSNNDGLISALRTTSSTYTSMTIGTITIATLTRPLIKSRSKEYLPITFTTTNPVVAGNLIRLSFTSFSSDFSLETTTVMCTLSEESTGTLDVTCSTSMTGSNLDVLISGCTNCLTSGGSTYTITIYGILMATPAATSIVFGMTLYATSTISTVMIVDRTTTGSTGATLTYQASATATDPEVGFSSLVMGCTNKRCRSYMYFTFTFTRRLVSADEQLVLTLGGYAKDNAVYQSNVICRINDASTNTVSFDWLSMDTSTMTQIFLMPKAEIDEGTSYIFYCDGIRTPYSTNPTQISGFVASQGSVSDIYYGYLASSAYSGITSQTLFSSNNLVLTSKLHNTEGSSVEFTFTIISTQIILSSTSYIYISFPTTFLPWLTSKYIYCLMDSIFVDCSIPEPYTVVITNLPETIAIGTSFEIQVFGLDQSALVYDDYQSVYVGVSNESSYQTMDEAGDIEDVVATSSPDRIFILKMDSTNNYIRSTGTYTMKVRLPAGNVLSGNYLYVDFPKVWDRIVNYVTPTCSLKNPANTTDYSGTCTTFGNRVTVPITSTDTNANNYYYLTIEDLRNPDETACQAQEIIISVSEDSGSTVASRSAPSMWNIAGIEFSKNPDQINLKWVNSTTLEEITQVTAYIGVFNSSVSVASDYGAFVKAFTIYTPNTDFYVDPVSPAAVLGYPTGTFQIAGSKTITQGLFLVQMQKTDDQDAQTALPFLKVQVKQKKFTVSLSGSMFRVPVSGHSLPLIIDMEECQSLYDSLFTGSLYDPSTPLISAAGLSFVNRSSLVLNYLAPKGFFMVASNANSVDPAGTGTIKLALSTLFQTYYNTLPTVSYAVVADKTVAPIAILSTVATTDKGATYMYIEGKCNQESVFYYLLSTEGARGLTTTQIIQGAWTWRTPSYTDPYHYHFGFVNIFMILTDESSGTVYNSQRVKVSSLRPSTVYNITGFCVNGNDQKSTSVQQLASTKGNSGIFLTIDFTFSETIKQDMAQQLACYLIVFFKIPSPYLRTSYDDYCSTSSRRRFLGLPPSDDDGDGNDDEYRGSHSQRNLAIATASTSTTIYIYPIAEQEKDTTTPNIQIAGIDSDLLSEYAYNNVTGLPAITSIGQPTLGDYIAPAFVNQTDYATSPSLTSVTVSGFLCDKTCYFYILVDLSSNSAPTYYDIRTGFNSSTATTFRYSSTVFTSKALSFEFTKLSQNTAYTVYYYAAAQDPSIIQPRSSVYTLTFTTTSVDSTYAAAIAFTSWVLLLIVAVL